MEYQFKQKSATPELRLKMWNELKSQPIPKKEESQMDLMAKRLYASLDFWKMREMPPIPEVFIADCETESSPRELLDNPICKTSNVGNVLSDIGSISRQGLQ